MRWISTFINKCATIRGINIDAFYKHDYIRADDSYEMSA